MGGQVVHHDDHAVLQGRDEHLFDVGKESGTVHGSVEHHRRGQATQRETDDEGDCFPMTMRDRCSASLSAWRTPPQPIHLRRHRGFVDEHQGLGIEVRLCVEPGLPTSGDVGALLLAGVRRFFYR
jgi:hypothetical protein